MPKSINLSGTPGRGYDLDQMSTQYTRTSANEELVVQIWYWNPNGIQSYYDENNKEKYENHKRPNPPRPKLGQIWLSKLVGEDFVEEV